MSSALRRTGLAVMRGLLSTDSEPEFWGYVLAITDNLLLTQLRKRRGNVRQIQRDPVCPTQTRASPIRDHPSEAAELLREGVMPHLDDADRELMNWKMREVPTSGIAAATGRSDGALRTQWARLRRRLREGAAADHSGLPPLVS